MIAREITDNMSETSQDSNAGIALLSMFITIHCPQNKWGFSTPASLYIKK